MKKIIFLSFFIAIPAFSINAQSKTISKSIISPTAILKKFHEKSELDGMQKGDLVDLYIERINVITKKLPFIALTNKRGVTINDVGIPDSIENNKILEKQQQTIRNFISETETFERTLTPFADKSDIIYAILFCENVLKEWRLIGE